MIDTDRVVIRAAAPSDIDAIKGCVGRAYGHYITGIGKPPGPMLADYADINACSVEHAVDDFVFEFEAGR